MAPSIRAASASSASTPGGTGRLLNGLRLVRRARMAACSSSSCCCARQGPASRTVASSNGWPGSGSSRTTGWRPATATARRRLNSAAPQEICNARLSGSATRSIRSGSADRPIVWLAGSNRKRHGCAFCIEGAAVAAATSSASTSWGKSRGAASQQAAFPDPLSAGSLPRVCWCAAPLWGGSAPRVDRKSTRLNSSHLVISHAVFCLKKKQQTLPYPDPGASSTSSPHFASPYASVLRCRPVPSGLSSSDPPPRRQFCLFFFFNDTATTEIYTLSLHDALPI